MNDTTATRNPLIRVRQLGQSIWLDYLRRHLVRSGDLRRLIDEDGLGGITSNPTIFEKTIGGSSDYDDDIRHLAEAGDDADRIYRAIALGDVRDAADVLRDVYDSSGGADGFVSLEVSPHLARDTEGTIAQARELWEALDRPNVMIKVPGTAEGLPAITQLIGEGINVNVTLLFGLPRYRAVADAYLAGLETLARAGKPLDRAASVASFFLSRIDVLVDGMLEELIAGGGARADRARRLHGEVAIASAREAYRIHEEVFGSDRFRALADRGARHQRLLWASTSTKNPQYSDVKYVEALIGPETVNTVPPDTLDAYRDHGRPEVRLDTGLDAAARTIEALGTLGIDLDAVTAQLEDEGIEKFARSLDQLMATLRTERQRALDGRTDAWHWDLGGYRGDVDHRIRTLVGDEFGSRLWRRDPTLWSRDPDDRESILQGLGWLRSPTVMARRTAALGRFARDVRADGYEHVVHLGMGGSSLAAHALQRILGTIGDGLPLTVLDTTDPATIDGLTRRLPLGRTLFVVASKSGTTAETRAFADYFYAKVRAVRRADAGSSFVAVTDPGTPLVTLAQETGYRDVFLGMPDVGGRYSALTPFGLVPAALMGIDVEDLLARAGRMLHACDACVPHAENPGVALGAALGELALHGRDKITFVMDDRLATLGTWLEQLLAESTGKDGRGLVPVAGEPVGEPSDYGDDRVFVRIRLRGAEPSVRDGAMTALRDAGHPIVTIQVNDPRDVAQEFVRWEIATATAGAILGINAFNQPNVEESKENTRRLLAAVESEGALPSPDDRVLSQGPLSWHTADTVRDPEDLLAQFIGAVGRGDYIAVMAYLTESRDTEAALERLRVLLRDGLHVATTVGYGPRFLHSTGQLHKGGPDTGRFLQLTGQDGVDAGVVGEPYGFATFRAAQALGDLQALREHGRHVIRADLGSDVARGLRDLHDALAAALAGAVTA